MERKKFYLTIIIVLLISNAISAFILFSNKPNRPDHGGPREYIIDKLDLSEKQVIQYDSLIDWHRSSIRNAEEQIFTLKSLLYSSLDAKDESVDSIITAINNVQHDLEKIHVKHFRDIEKICNDDQKNKFKSLSLELSSLFKPKKP